MLVLAGFLAGLSVGLLVAVALGDPGDPTEHKQGNGGRA